MFGLSRVIGHRGLAEIAPENTLAGLRAARAAGLAFVEVDILPSADGVAVLSHDDSLLRRGGIEGKVTETGMASLAAVRAGVDFPKFAGEGIPTARDALTYCAGAGMGMILELKPEGGRPGAQALATALAEARSSGGIPERLMVSSFGAEMLDWARELIPDIPRALNIWDLREDWRRLAADLNCENIHANWRAVNPFFAREVAAAGLGLYCYTVNNRGLYLLLRATGVDGVFTDSPKVAALGGSRL